MIDKVIISDDLVNYLENRNLGKQYKKAKEYLLKGLFRKIDFKIREPKKNKIYYFRINKQFRAFCKLEGNILKIFESSAKIWTFSSPDLNYIIFIYNTFIESLIIQNENTEICS